MKFITTQLLFLFAQNCMLQTTPVLNVHQDLNIRPVTEKRRNISLFNYAIKAQRQFQKPFGENGKFIKWKRAKRNVTKLEDGSLEMHKRIPQHRIVNCSTGLHRRKNENNVHCNEILNQMQTQSINNNITSSLLISNKAMKFLKQNKNTSREPRNKRDVIQDPQSINSFLIPLKFADDVHDITESVSSLDTSVFHLPPDANLTFDSENRTYDLNSFLVSEDINLRKLLDFFPVNGNHSNILISDSPSYKQYSDSSNSTSGNLTQNFDCLLQNTDALFISCSQVPIYSIGAYLPNNTVSLKISYSEKVTLLNPLFPQLKELKYLSLTHNHHRRILRAFMGLENLETLDLSNNDIIVINKAFSYLPKLKILNLSNNSILRIRTIARAISYTNSVQNLTLDHNTGMSHITEEDLYPLLDSNIIQLSIFNTTLRYIEKGSFTFVPQLKTLEISVNYMNENALANITCGISNSVEILFIRQLLRVTTFPHEAINCLKHTSIQKIYISHNYFTVLPKLPYLPKLRLLSLSQCSLKLIQSNAFDGVPRLESLILNNNELVSIPTAISSARNLKKLYIEKQRDDMTYKYIPDYAFQNLSNLEELGMSKFHFRKKITRYLFYGLKSLKYGDFSVMNLFDIEDFAFETLTSLEILDLRGNGIKLLYNNTFYGLKNLKHLYLSANHIEFKKSAYPFQFLPALNVILLHNNEVENIPFDMFSKQQNIQILIFTMNKIIPWTKRIFPKNFSLQYLGLSGNNIDYVTDVMLDEFSHVTVSLDLTKNPLNCSSCGMKAFQDFCINSNLSLRLPIPEQENAAFVCIEPKSLMNENFLNVELPEYKCDELENTILSLLTIILACCFILIVVVASSVCYMFRWYIRYWIFHLQSTGKKKQSLSDKDYKYDAFVVYNSSDSPWVANFLLPAVEGQDPKFKLCIHERDFRVGTLITENILEATDKSRRVILILSEDFLKSEWCMFELHLAQNKLFRDSRDYLLLVKLKSIDKKFKTKNITYLEKTRKCLFWTDNPVGQKLFWEQMRKELSVPYTNTVNETV